MLAGAPAFAQGLLPASGIDVRTGDLRSQLERAYSAGPPSTTPGWTFTSAMDASITWSNPVQNTGGGAPAKGGDVYTTLTPSISVFGESQRLKGGLFLDPELRRYLIHNNLNTIDTNFSGQAHATLLQDTLYLDVTGTSANQSRSGGLPSTASISRSDSVQTTTFMISPSAVHEFSDYGTARAGASLSETLSDSMAAVTTASPFNAPYSNAPMTSKEAHASFRTGDILGLTAAELHTSMSQKDGGGALRNSSRSSTALDVDRYINRDWTLLTSFGVEEIRYGGLTPRRFSNATWSGGARWVPNADSTITVKYGRHDSAISLTADASYAITSRIKLGATYSEGISTGQEDAQNALTNSKLNNTGVFIDPTTGLPIYGNNNFFGANGNSAYRYKRASATASLLYDRDVYTVGLRSEDQSLISASSVSAPGGSSGIYADLAVQHDLNPNMKGSAFVEAGQRTTPGAAIGPRVSAAQNSLSIGGSLTFILSESLTGRLNYTFSSTTSQTAALNRTSNLALLGVHKTF